MAVKKERTRTKEGTYLRELAALVLIALATVFALSLVSYDALDDTILSRNFSRSAPRNYIGPVGANLAAVSYQLIGLSAYLIPATLFVLGGCLAMRIEISAIFTKTIGLAGLFLSTTAGFSLLFPALIAGGNVHPFPGGGLLGKVLLDSMRTAFSDLASYIVVATTIAVSLLLTVHFSFGKLFRWIWDGLSKAFTGYRERKRAEKRLRKRKSR